jgi:hypothetical protein
MARLGQVRKVRWCNKILVIFVWSVLKVATSASRNTLFAIGPKIPDKLSEKD